MDLGYAHRYAHSKGVSDNVRRQTGDNRKRIMVYARVSMLEYNMIQELKRIRGTSNESQIIREALHAYHGLLAGVKEIKPASNIVIQNPIVNMNINNNENKVAVKLQMPQDLLRKLDDLLDLLSFIAFQADERVYPEPVRKRAESGYQALRQLKRILVDLN